MRMALTRGQVATAAEVHSETLRYYERRGLLPAVRRTAAGYRQYEPDAVTRIRFIKHAQKLGFSLPEIRELLALRVRDGAACADVARRSRDQLALVRRKIDDLQRIQRTLRRLVAACAKRRPTDQCPVLASLERNRAVRR
jgi:Hg(II)-responsive transcriptional regulator